MRMFYPRGACLFAISALTLVSLSTILTSSSHPAHALAIHPPAADRARLPDALLPRVNASLAADDPAYAVAAMPGDRTTLRAANAAHHLTTTFAPGGIAFTGEHGARWSLRLSAIGADAVRPMLAPLIVGTRVEYRRGDLTEWYLNGPLGVEQGFTLAAPLSSGDALALSLAISGGATPQINGSDVTLTVPGGETFQYGHLRVTDATGRQLPAHLEVDAGAIAITADLAGATYPVTVDPMVQQKILTASDGADGDFFGGSVAMSSDGTRVVVGAYNKQIGANQQQGAAYVYSGTNYGTEKRLLASNGAEFDEFGIAVAMNGDGTQVIVGAINAAVAGNPQQGAVYIYSGANYATEKRLSDSDGLIGDAFGSSVAMSNDGTKVIVGANLKIVGMNDSQGAAYIYSGANYATEKKLTASDGAANDYFGSSVGMSGDGSKVIVGAYRKQVGANAKQGAAYVYSGTNYVTAQRLAASDGAADDTFGNAVAMSSDGTHVIVGAAGKQLGANTDQGATYIFGTPALPNPLPNPLPAGPPQGGPPAPLPRPQSTVPVSGGPNPLPARRP